MSYNEEIESYGLIPQEEVIYSTKKFTAINNEGYYVVGVLDWIRRTNTLPRVFDKSNPYTLQNIKRWCQLNDSNRELVSTEYKGNKIHLEWYCKIHKENFPQKWNSVLNGNKCPQCSREVVTNKNTYTQEQALESLIKTHGNKYDLSKVVYTKSTNKIIVICRKHGEFEIVYKDFQSGKGCRKCVDENTSIRCKANVAEMIKKFNAVHNNKYDYSKVTQDNYINSLEKITIYCKKHRIEFQQSSGHHMQGEQCPLCAKESMKSILSHNQDDVIKKFIEIHQNKYDYQNVNYVNNKIPVLVKCNIHNYKFFIQPNHHLNTQGCPLCALENRGWFRTKWVNAGLISKQFDSYKVYVLKCYDKQNRNTFYKIGRTYHTVAKRFQGKYKMKFDYEILKQIENSDGNYIYNLEVHLLRLHHQQNLAYLPDENFSGKYECFKEILDIDKILLDFNNNICNI